MASILSRKKKGKSKSKSKAPETKSVDINTLEDGPSGSQVSVKEALEENTADNINNKQNEEKLILDEEIDLKDAPRKGKKKSKGTARGEKGDNPGLIKPAWRGKSLDKEHYDPAKESFVKGSSVSTPIRGRNSVEPLDKGSNSLMGSSASLQSSSSSVKAAWSDENSSDPAEGSKKEKKEGSVVSLSKADKNEKNSLDGDSQPDLSVVKATPGQAEQHAYVPYIYARDCIVRITDDMKSMKANHVRIVREIEMNYHHIEDETQSQFNTFILLLRTEYSGKVKTFRQVIDTHRQELEHKDEYWNRTLASLSEKNRQLLNDKKALLIKNKVEVEKLEKEKESTIKALTHKLEASEAATASIDKEKHKELEKVRVDQASEHLIVIQRLEDEKKILEEQLESEKSEVKTLQHQLGEKVMPTMAVNQATAPSSGDSTTTQEMQGGTTVGFVPVLGAEQSQVTEERQKIAEERKRIEEERAKMLAERESFTSEREELNADREMMRNDLTASRKESAELLAKYTIVCGQAKDVERVTTAYRLLEEQYNALASVTTAAALNTGDSQKLTKENLKKTDEEVAMMKGEKKNMDKDIEKWEKDFEAANGRPPTEADKSDTVKELFTSRDEVNTMLDSLERKKETLHQLQSGTVPTVKSAPQSVVAASEPVVTTVEVEVPDPKTVKALEENQALVAELRAELSALNSENTTLQIETTDLRTELEQAQEEITILRESGGSAGAEDSEEQISALNLEVSSLENKLLQERSSHDQTREELEVLTTQLRALREEESTKHVNLTTELETVKSTSQAELKAKDEVIQSQKARLDELEKERLSKLPPDTAKEIKNLQAKIALLEKEKLSSGTTAASTAAKLKEIQTKLEAATASQETARASNRELEGKLKKFQGEKEKAMRELTNQLEKKEQQRIVAEKSLTNLQTKLKSSDSGAVKEKSTLGAKDKAGAGVGASDSNLKRENVELKRRIKELEAELKRAGKSAVGAGAAGEGAASDRQTVKKQEKILKELEKKLDLEMRKREKHEQNLKIREEELSSLQKENDTNKRELAAARTELSALGVSAQQGAEAAAKVKSLESEVKRITEENKTLTDNFNSERVLRKKYYNMVEDMKGKIRVYCRSRPLSKTEQENGNYEVAKSPDEYSIQVDSSRGIKEFQFDQIFMPDSSQERVFEDTNNLIQSAVDGYNVCIFAYGQTGSGKTFTMIGDREQKYPGIAPRSFQRIFEIIAENDSKYKVKVSTYMLELYNDHLLDLYGNTDEDRLDIKKDKQGMVFVQGAAVKQASNAKELYALFEEGSKNRHVASTKMNAESSRSHLVLAMVIESTNRATGQVTKGKLSLVDLAGSERVGKTGASAEQLKEAMSINKSLSALGDVISALSSEQTFIPYRNNKLTMLMQDSLGGNAKTLMFVNISPANYNCDETIVSLTYASRVKLITNSAQKNADNKEIARLKDIINKLKQGEQVEEEV